MKAQMMKLNSKKDGSALVLAMCITAIVTLSAASLMLFADYQLDAMKRAREDNAAIVLAEAGANAAYAVIKTNFANKDNASLFPVTSYNGGSYDATVTSVGSDKAQIKCVGISGTSTQTVIVDIRDFTVGSGSSTNVDMTSPYAYTIFSNGDITFNGSGNLMGNVRCNQSITGNGSFNWGAATNPCYVYVTQTFNANGNSTLAGMVYAPTVNAKASVPRTIQAVPMIAMPTLPFASYYNTAVANGQVFAGGTVSGTIGTIPGGVRWYNGSLTVNGGVSYVGCVIATGSINFKGGCTATPVAGLPLVASRDGSVTLSGSRNITGLVYSFQDYTCNGAGTLRGTVICGGHLTLNGSYGVHGYLNTGLGDGGGGGSGGTTNPVIGVTAWQK